ncbi:MAG: hypothetical protein U0136_13725 [Bdellovibrionota bacterium]
MAGDQFVSFQRGGQHPRRGQDHARLPQARQMDELDRTIRAGLSRFATEHEPQLTQLLVQAQQNGKRNVQVSYDRTLPPSQPGQPPNTNEVLAAFAKSIGVPAQNVSDLHLTISTNGQKLIFSTSYGQVQTLTDPRTGKTRTISNDSPIAGFSMPIGGQADANSIRNVDYYVALKGLKDAQSTLVRNVRNTNGMIRSDGYVDFTAGPGGRR